ncbi:hypothetical protein AMELA_G00276870 [Ameiurus melas]|uniref:Uncharacterized protein n=1 Tax=Ameiurus melas TaxID=219545 RepID=A0A7J5ZJU1_AMEME|nr:hypothetical protein AMELA_G00276870 [Ameiurus melas]
MDPIPAFKMNYLLCPVCKKTWDCLSVHLRRVCMKTHDEAEIEAAVERAKAEMRALLATGRVFKYGRLCQIVAAPDPVSRLIEELESRFLVVIDVPPPLPTTIERSGPSSSRATQPTGLEGEPSEHSSVGSGTSSESSGETFQCYRDVQWKSPARKLITKKGLYKKHSTDHAMLRGFFSFLQRDLQNENPNQEVEDVARFLCYMDPRAPSLEFVRDREKTQQFFRELTGVGLSKQTQLNYMKSLKRFLTYQTISTNLRHDDNDLHTDCREFIDFLGLLQKWCCKNISKEISQKRHERSTTEAELTTHDCAAVLRAAKEDFLAIGQKMLSEKQLTTGECLDYMYFLQALVILKHLQRPGVVSHMTVPEWLNKMKTTSGYTVVGVKTSAQQVAMFALSQEEDTWFELYYTCVRPQLQSCIKKRNREVTNGTEERFFISSASGRIHNPSNDLQRLHKKYGIKPWVTSQKARRVFKTATKSLTETEKSLVVDYLTHSTAIAEKHYRMKQADNVMRASQLLDLPAGQLSTDPSDGESSRAACSIARSAAQQKAETTDLPMDFEAAYNRLVERRPVTLEAAPHLPSEEKAQVISDQGWGATTSAASHNRHIRNTDWT